MRKAILTDYKYNTIIKSDYKIFGYSLFGFFLSRGIIFTFISPLAIPFLTLFLGQGIFNFSILYIAVVVGLYQTFNGVFFYCYFIGATLVLLTNIYINLNKEKKEYLSTITMGIISALSIFLGGIIVVVTYNFSFYFLVCFLLFSIYSFLVPIVLSPGFNIFTFKGTIKPLITDEIISVCIIFSGFILGTANFNFTYININTYSIILVVIILAYSAGIGNAIAAAFSLSFISFISNQISESELIIFSIFGIFAGLSKVKSKQKSMAISLLGLIIGYFYVNKSFFHFSNLVSILLSYVTFYFLPENWYLILQSTFGQTIDNTEDYGEKIKYFTYSKLNNFSKSFLQLSKTFKSLAVKKERLNQEDISVLIDKVAKATCNNCKKRKHCWQIIFYTTYKLTSKLIEDIEDGDKEKINKSKESFSAVCEKSSEFISNTYIYFDFFKENLLWHNKISENKSLIADQLTDISNIFSNIGKDLNEKIIFLPKQESVIYKSLENNKIFANKVLVLKNQKGVYNIWISLDINISEKNAFKTIQKCVSAAVGNNVKILSTTLMNDGKYEIYLEESYKYRVSFGVAKSKKSKSDVSGDSYSTQNLESGETLIAISDGMGSGKLASIDSAAAIELFEEFIEAGFDKKLAIKLINSSLILKSSMDTFTTLDACIVDLHKGIGQFMKIGAVPSFILRGNETITINSKSLPIGILSDIDMDIMSKQLRDNDMIVLMSDGILNVIHSIDDQNKWLRKVIKSYESKNPQDLADHIILSATSMAKGNVEDDMTVVVGKIIKNRNI